MNDLITGDRAAPVLSVSIEAQRRLYNLECYNGKSFAVVHEIDDFHSIRCWLKIGISILMIVTSVDIFGQFLPRDAL